MRESRPTPGACRRRPAWVLRPIKAGLASQPRLARSGPGYGAPGRRRWKRREGGGIYSTFVDYWRAGPVSTLLRFPLPGAEKLCSSLSLLYASVVPFHGYCGPGLIGPLPGRCRLGSRRISVGLQGPSLVHPSGPRCLTFIVHTCIQSRGVETTGREGYLFCPVLYAAHRRQSLLHDSWQLHRASTPRPAATTVADPGVPGARVASVVCMAGPGGVVSTASRTAVHGLWRKRT